MFICITDKTTQMINLFLHRCGMYRTSSFPKEYQFVNHNFINTLCSTFTHVLRLWVRGYTQAGWTAFCSPWQPLVELFCNERHKRMQQFQTSIQTCI